MTARLLDAVAKTRDARREAEQAFLRALREARRGHSWNEIAAVARLPRNTVRYLTMTPEERRRWNGLEPGQRRGKDKP